MAESAFTRLWNAIKPPPAVRAPESATRQLTRKQKTLLIVPIAALAAGAAAWGVYSYFASAQQRAQDEFQAAMKLMEPGHYQQAIPRFTRAIDTYPLAEAYLERGIAQRFLSDNDAARADFEKALDLDPTLARAHSGLGSIYRGQGDFKRAMDEYTKSLAIAPNTDAYFERGQTYESMGEHQKAIDDFTKAIEGARDAPYVYRARGLARRNLGDITGYEADREQASVLEHH